MNSHQRRKQRRLPKKQAYKARLIERKAQEAAAVKAITDASIKENRK